MDSHLETLQREIAAAMAAFSAEQLLAHPAGKWCAAEILEHLYLTYTGTAKGFSRVLAGGKPLASPNTWKNRARALVVVGFGYMPHGREAPVHARPRGLPAEKVTAEIASALAAMDEAIAACARQFGAGTKVLDHPFLGPLTSRQWCKFHLVHGRHHLKQIHQLSPPPKGK